MNTNTFRQKQKELLGEITQTGAQPTFTDQQLDSWRNDAVGVLYSKNLYTIASTRGTLETQIVASGGVTPRYFALPAGWRRVFNVEFISDTSLDVWDGTANSFNDLEVPGFIRIDEAQDWVGDYLRFVGEKEYSGVDDPYMKAEVNDVVLFDSIMRALVGEYFKRLKASRSQGAGRKTDISPGAIAAGIGLVRTLHHDALGRALNLNKTNTRSV
jgi:hypothetical protein